jgi:hypothetical protein
MEAEKSKESLMNMFSIHHCLDFATLMVLHRMKDACNPLNQAEDAHNECKAVEYCVWLLTFWRNLLPEPSAATHNHIRISI